jgi:hypothetical protein
MSLPNPLALLGGKVGDIIGSLGGLLDKVSTTDEERLAAKAELLKLHSELTLGLAQVDAQFADARAKVLVAEAQSESWLTRNWRPILMLSFTAILIYNYVFCLIFGWPSSDIPTDLWAVIKIGVGGYVMGRTVENVASYAPDVAANLRGPQPPQ